MSHLKDKKSEPVHLYYVYVSAFRLVSQYCSPSGIETVSAGMWPRTAAAMSDLLTQKNTLSKYAKCDKDHETRRYNGKALPPERFTDTLIPEPCFHALPVFFSVIRGTAGPRHFLGRTLQVRSPTFDLFTWLTSVFCLRENNRFDRVKSKGSTLSW